MNSPFIFRKGTVQEEKFNEIEMGNINQLVSNKAIDDIDLKVLNYLAIFDVLTASLLDQIFKREQFYTSKFAKNRFKKYLKYGIVNRYSVVFENEEMDHKKSINFYTLSNAAYKYLKKYSLLIFIKYPTTNIMKVGEVLKVLATNQLRINYSHVDPLFKYKKTGKNSKIFFKNKEYQLHVLRGDQDASIEVTSLINTKLNIILVENELHAIRLWRKYKNEIEKMYFVTDLMLVSDSMRESYLFIEEQLENIIVKEYTF